MDSFIIANSSSRGNVGIDGTLDNKVVVFSNVRVADTVPSGCRVQRKKSHAIRAGWNIGRVYGLPHTIFALFLSGAPTNSCKIKGQTQFACDPGFWKRTYVDAIFLFFVHCNIEQ